MDGKLTISPIMFTLGFAREVMVLYKALFGAIITKSPVRDLSIKMAGVLLFLVGGARGGGRGSDRKGVRPSNY